MYSYSYYHGPNPIVTVILGPAIFIIQYLKYAEH